MLYWKILSCIMAVVYGLSKSYAVFHLRRESNTTRVMDALTVGVFAAWEQVVKPWLIEHDNEKPLPDAVRADAEDLAISEAALADPIISKTPRRILRPALKRALEESKRIGGV